MTRFATQLNRTCIWLALIGFLCMSISTAKAQEQQLIDLDFQRTPKDQARLLLEFAVPPQLPESSESHIGLSLNFANTQIAEEIRNLYDTNDFNTLVSSLSLDQEGRDALVSIEVDTSFSYTLHQQDNWLIVDISPRSQTASDTGRTSPRRIQYTGEPMTLSYQNIPVRELLKEMASFLDLNLIAGENVRGNITLELNEVPSDQALDLILTTKNLASRQVGNVLLVAPSEELVALQQQQAEARKSDLAVEPLVDEFIRVHFANAEDLRTFILGDQQASNVQQPASIASGLFGGELMQEPTTTNDRRFLSDRGHLMVDRRTNQVYVRDTAEYVERIRTIIETLDVPVDQVMIEARIVVARTGVSDELGVTWGASRTSGGSASGFATERGRIGPGNRTEFESTGSGRRGGSLDFNPQTGLGIGFVNNNFLLDLELAALETENRSEIISQPKVITSDRVQATIRSGEQIPYRKVEDGTVSVEFQNAELVLEVLPQITSDGRILMKLQVNNDSKGEETADGFTINSNSINTQVLANNGETIVIGGIFTSQTLESVAKTPILGDLPLLGWLFRRSFQSQEKVELLVFITPRMLSNSLTATGQ
ncbi:type IV pilus assembly protein PilQ [Marinospirillum celere]|uniref:Type IV pilus assembly protein PilQ n=1 Tax=Marinospirillum celere TaxID=1122252 RepID=A0A1I1ING1_9GAMM|nr:type IV pilus secretin PilQ [Marinospirillum celere]SFC37745.1 type IV pilus assembly protein PilQ [Marinospirillum celere]